MTRPLSFPKFIARVRDCDLCRPSLPLVPRPILQASESAKLLIAAQAPGTRAHDMGKPFDDPSGERLREWLGLDPDTFYDATKVAIVPMGFCYPGKGKSGDLPPRPECAETWHSEIFSRLKNLQFSLIIGRYAQRYHMPDRSGTLTENVKDWRREWPHRVLLPHPSPRNNIWLRRNPWFEDEVVPRIQRRVQKTLFG